MKFFKKEKAKEFYKREKDYYSIKSASSRGPKLGC